MSALNRVQTGFRDQCPQHQGNLRNFITVTSLELGVIEAVTLICPMVIGLSFVSSSAFPLFPPVAPPRSDSMYPVSGLPPQLPPRNKADSADPAPAPPPRNLSNASLPPPPPSVGTKFSRYASNENLQPTSPPGDSASVTAVSRRGSQAAPPSPAHQHTRTRSSPVSLERTLELAKSIMSGVSETMGGDRAGLNSGQKSPRYETPPGTPPPPYILPQLVTWSNVTSGAGPDIITMEDDSDDNMEEVEGDAEARGELTFSLPPEGDHGPFNSLTELMQHPAHLAVFLNYVISNSDPNPLLFYLIIDAYKSGSVKEMRKWAYEIHSCFLVPR